MTQVSYFAYGSNMLTERLRARSKSATFRCTAGIDGYRLAFCKKSRDGSGKATLSPCSDAGCRVLGAVFDLEASELPKLDEAEGAGNGYERINDFQVYVDGLLGPLNVITYIAASASIDPGLKPYDWYLKLIVAGARQHQLPSQYVGAIEAVQSIPDPNPERKSRLEALELLGEQPE